MQIGIIGLGRMGNDMALRLMEHEHQCVAYDVSTEAVARLTSKGALGADSLENMVAQLQAPRVVWLMVPAAIVDDLLTKLTPLLAADDIVIDGGNSYYRDDIRRAAALQSKGIHYVDAGTSGGIFGLKRGYCLMIGGEKEPVHYLSPIFAALAPGDSGLPRTANRQEKPESTAELGYLHCGANGAGHFVKMVHNGIEYGLMAAYAEGLNILRHADLGTRAATADAETAPVREPEFYQYKFDLPEIAEVWRRGSVISSWLLDLAANALQEDPALAKYDGRVSDSGEGRWTLIAAIDEAVPAPVLSTALYERFSSRDGAGFANKLLSALRHQFGGHAEKPAEKSGG